MSERDIQKRFNTKELSYLDAIEALEGLGYLSKEAEALVETWEKSNELDNQ